MPIGFDAGDFGGGRTSWAPPGAGSGGFDPVAGLRDRLDPWRAPPAPEPPQGFWARFEVDASTVEPVVHQVWVAGASIRGTCPECSPLVGGVWEDGFGPYPPVHPNCVCRRAYHHTEWRVRPATAWELRWVAT